MGIMFHKHLLSENASIEDIERASNEITAYLKKDPGADWHTFVIATHHFKTTTSEKTFKEKIGVFFKRPLENPINQIDLSYCGYKKGLEIIPIHDIDAFGMPTYFNIVDIDTTKCCRNYGGIFTIHNIWQKLLLL